MQLPSVVAVALAATVSARLTANSVQAKTDNLTSLTSKADGPMMRANAYNSHSSTLSQVEDTLKSLVTAMQIDVDEFQQPTIAFNNCMYTPDPEGCMDYLEENLEDPSMSVGKGPIFPEAGQEAVCTAFRKFALAQKRYMDSVRSNRVFIRKSPHGPTVSRYLRELKGALHKFDAGVIQLVPSCRSDMRWYGWPMEHVVDTVVNRYE